MSNYASFPSIERLENIYCVISEKVDGTNGLIEINETSVRFGSRNRYISFNDDNAGFANFFRHYETKFEDVAKDIIIKELELNGETLTPYNESYPLRIYGEWFGSGIQRGYGLKNKFFMPFNTFYAEKLIEYQVPNIVKPNIMYTGKFSQEIVNTCMQTLTNGSLVIPEFKRPEGIVIYFPKYDFRLKQTFKGSKWQQGITKSKHDKKPNYIEESCHSCGKRLYKRENSLVCMNYYCSESPNYYTNQP